MSAPAKAQISQTLSSTSTQQANTSQAEKPQPPEPAPYLYIAGLSVLATLGLVAMWWIFWSAIVKAKESVHDILMSPSFFRVVTVMGVIAATVVLSLAGKMEGSMTGAILSGIVGYVLGHISTAQASGKEELPRPKETLPEDNAATTAK